ncbi:hypothetical protein M0802_008334 [Mischocyttarus mexicanus]|nr:hypothetical protein M0802_008334 [Mischocyttarus mexicanus]
MNCLPVTECIREFPLRQQYPSIVPKKESNNQSNVKIEKDLNMHSLAQTKIKCFPRINLNMNGEFQKLRLKSRSGKDLGEFNAKVLSLNNMKNKSLLKQNKLKNLNKSILLSSLMSKDNSKKLVTLVPIESVKEKKHTINLSKLTNVISPEKDGSCVENKTCKPKTVLLKRNIINNKCHIEKQDTNTIVIDNFTKNKCNEKEKFECNKINSAFVENESDLKKKENVNSNIRLFEKTDKLVNTNSLPESSKSILYCKSKNVIGSTSSIITIDKKSVRRLSDANKIIDKNSDLSSYEPGNDEILSNNKKQLFLLPTNNEDDTDVSSTQKLPTFLNKSNDFRFSLECTDILNNERNNKNISEYKKTLDQNTEAEEKLSWNGYTETELNDDTFFHVMHFKHTNPVVTKTNNPENVLSKNISDELSKSILDDNELFSRFDLDKEIRYYLTEKSLQAEADDKANKTRKNRFIINNGPIQMLIDNNSLNPLRVEEVYSVEPIKSPPRNENMPDISKQTFEKVYSVKAVENVNQENNINNNLLMPVLKAPQTFNENVETFTKDMCNKNSETNKVQKILSETIRFHSKIFKQLKTDFLTVKKMNDVGIMNIHRAVLNNKIRDVERHLMVLKACDIDVDIPTKFYMTSLELAIKHKMSTDIVKLLLQYGANPTSPKKVHESALIMACKMEHILLPELIKHVKFIEQLNNVDNNGYSPLHYCAQNGNLKGVILLINKGVDINLRENTFGRTAVFLAIQHRHFLVATKLIENGAEKNIPTFSGQTIISMEDRFT